MGYTHYWEWTPEPENREYREAFGRLMIDADTIVKAAAERTWTFPTDTGSERGTDFTGPILLEDDNPYHPPLSEAGIFLNGRRPHDYETFVLWADPVAMFTRLAEEYPDDARYIGYKLAQYEERGGQWDCCKTGRRPYDVIVATILLRALHHLAPYRFRFTSDGCWEDEWLNGAWGWHGSPYVSIDGDPSLGARAFHDALFPDGPRMITSADPMRDGD